MDRTRSRELMERALRAIPGGVNSPVRAFRAVGGEPLFIARGDGAYLTDVDGNRFLDCVGSWGPLIFGHTPPPVRHAVMEQLDRGTTYGAPTEAEVVMAETLQRLVPSCGKVRLVSSGTEATMSAIRAARGFTGRAKILKFEGCYHGHADYLLAKSGSGVATLGLPDSAGVPPSVAYDTVTVPYNDLDAARSVFRSHGNQIACVIVEPVAGNMGCVPPCSGFLEGLRDLCTQAGAILIFDEVMTGFRVAKGGAQELLGVLPDLTTLGKVMGGGLPAAAYGGRSEIMDSMAPLGPVYQAGTLSGNPLAVAAGLATLRMIEEDAGLYRRLNDKGRHVAEGLRSAATKAGIPAAVNQVGSMFTLFFTPGPVTDYASAKTSDTQRFARFHAAMLDRGIYLPPSQFEAAFLSDAMTEADLDLLLAAAAEAFRTL
ncbi:MAG: glutamate-1-semialdehyde 2,1-aminomutase [Chthonomonadales bacterium]